MRLFYEKRFITAAILVNKAWMGTGIFLTIPIKVPLRQVKKSPDAALVPDGSLKSLHLNLQAVSCQYGRLLF